MSDKVDKQAKKLVEIAINNARQPADNGQPPFHIDVDVAQSGAHSQYDYHRSLAWAKKVCTMPEFDGLLDYTVEGPNGYVTVQGMLPNIDLVNKFAEQYGSGYATQPSESGKGTDIFFE